MRKTPYSYMLAIQEILNNASEMDKQDILNKLNDLLNDKGKDSAETSR